MSLKSSSDSFIPSHDETNYSGTYICHKLQLLAPANVKYIICLRHAKATKIHKKSLNDSNHTHPHYR